MRGRRLVSLMAIAATVLTVGAATSATATTPAKPAITVVTGTLWDFAVSCATQTLCVAGGSTNTTSNNGEGFIEKIVDGTPGAVVPIAGTNEIAALSCPTATFCEAVASSTTAGSGLIAITNGKPGKLVPLPAHDGFSAVSCSTETLCEAVGQGQPSDAYHEVPIFAVVHAGKLGHVSSLSTAVGLGSSLYSVSCVSGLRCTSVGAGVFGAQSNELESFAVDTVDGKPGSTHFKSGMGLGAVSCYHSLAQCWATGSEATTVVGLVAAVRNGVIGTVHDIAGTHEAEAISCYAATRCTVSGNERPDPSQQATTAITTAVSGGKAGKLNEYSPNWDLDAISCSIASLCTAVGVTSITPSAEGIVLSTVVTPHKDTLELRAAPATAHKLSKKVLLVFEVKHLAGQPAPTGTVTFSVGAETLCGSLTLIKSGGNGRVLCKSKAARIGRGRHTIVASYSGDAAYQGGKAKAVFRFVRS